jgi:PhzF family phenazine biosynthesis protein
MSVHAFSQVDVFSSAPLGGNPLAVVHDADALTDEQMAAFARWTNLSETTFLCEPTDPDAADYRLRIFTPGGELPFAGHPTLGSAHTWLAASGMDTVGERTLTQECAAGLVTLKVTEDGAIAFAAPPLVRSGEVDDADLDQAVRALGIGRADVVAANWVDNGPGWLGVLLRDAETVRALEPDLAAMGEAKVGVVGPTGDAPTAGTTSADDALGSPDNATGDAADDTASDPAPAFEVRAFVPSLGVGEDPVTGSLNAGLAQWLIGTGTAPQHYVAAQGTCLGRRGRVRIDADGVDVWVGGACTTVISGTVQI